MIKLCPDGPSWLRAREVPIAGVNSRTGRAGSKAVAGELEVQASKSPAERGEIPPTGEPSPPRDRWRKFTTGGGESDHRDPPDYGGQAQRAKMGAVAKAENRETKMGGRQEEDAGLKAGATPVTTAGSRGAGA